MATKHRAHDEESWRNAKKICRLNARQLEMARRLGMNPKKLPRLRPSAQQHWKLPVGAFIEELYWKRFGGDPLGHQPNAKRGSRKPALTQRNALSPGREEKTGWQVADLVCCLMNLGEDLQKWLAHDVIDREVLPQVAQELRAIASALETGASIDPVPGIPLPPGPTFSRRDDQEPIVDDEIPF